MKSAYYNIQGLVGILCSRAEVYTLLGRGNEALADLERVDGLAGEMKPMDARKRLQLNGLLRRIKVYALQARYSEMEEVAEKSLKLSRALGDRKGEGGSLNDLGNVQYYRGTYERALDFYQHSLAIRRETGDRPGEASCLNNIGSTYDFLGDYGKGLTCFRHALAIYQELGDRQGEAVTLNNIGSAHTYLAEYDRALVHYHRSLSLRREMGDRRGEASCLNNIGTVHNYLGEYEKALGQYHRALVIRQAIGDLGGQASTLGNIGKACLEMGAFPEAEEAFRQGERLVQGLGAKRLRAYLVDGLATLALEQGELSLAEERIGCLRSLAGEIRSREHEGIAFCLQGRLHVRRGEGARAWAAFREAMAIFKDIREEYELGKACYYYAQGLRQLVGAREAEWYRVQAREIFARLGAKGWLRRMEADSGGASRSEEAPAGL